jgi:thiol-disulfide isomerase/thioredoxin
MSLRRAAPLVLAWILLAGASVFVPAPRAEEEEVGLYDYAMNELDGKETNLSAYKGKVLVVEFFATWCPPCRKDLPAVTALAPKYPPEKVAFIAVSADAISKTVEKVPAFVREAEIKVPVLLGGGIFIDKFAGIDKRGGREVTLPQTYVFSGEGEILLRLVGDQKAKAKILSEELDRILREARPSGAAP